jgi:hypothetical protein
VDRFANGPRQSPNDHVASLIVGRNRKDDPWGFAPDLLGARFALDTLNHECIHVSIHYRLGGGESGESSHNNPEWIAEVNRIAPLIWLDGIDAGMSKVVREGKKVKRKSLGNVPYDPAVCKFPRAFVFIGVNWIITGIARRFHSTCNA